MNLTRSWRRSNSAFPYQWSSAANPTKQAGAAFRQDGADWVGEAKGTTALVEGQSGWLKSYQVTGRELLASPLRLNFWREPTDNDTGWKVPQ